VKSSLRPFPLITKELRSNSSVGRWPGRRSWHLFEVVSFDGCPGFKGPAPQPVSMSVSKSMTWMAATQSHLHHCSFSAGVCRSLHATLRWLGPSGCI